jgi:ABC-type multidrug transport system fused ATPase/permease subunit
MSVAAILGGFAEAGLLVLIARIAFALTSDSDEINVHLGPLGSMTFSITALLVIAAVLVGARMLLQTAQNILSTRAMAATVQRVRVSLMSSYLGSEWSLQSSEREGRLQGLVTSYTAECSAAVSALTGVGISGFNLVALLVSALFINAIASVGAAIAALAVGLILRPLRAVVRRRSARAAQANLEFGTGVTEVAASLQEVRVFDVEPQVSRRLETLSETAVRRGIATAYANSAVQVLYQGIGLLLIVGALAVAYTSSFSRLASLGAIVLIMVRSLTYAQGVQGSVQRIHESAPYLESLAEEVTRFEAAAIPRGGRRFERIGGLRFEHVFFEYEPGRPVLLDISFEVPKGEIIGIVGPSGAGKSTMVQLLLRLRHPTAGTFLVDGEPADALSLADWYKRVTFVPQEARLFAGSVADNIRFYRDDVDDVAIERAAKRAYLHEEIVAFANSYDTQVGERGGQLSGGQRQRLCIARALVDEPDVMVLDEPTSSLDVRSESLIRETLAELRGQSTVFVIAHRLSTLAICDRLMVLLGGALQGFDAPEQLEATNPFYREALVLSGLRAHTSLLDSPDAVARLRDVQGT